MSETLVGGAPAQLPAPGSAGASPWTLARRRLLRNRVAMAMVGVLVVIVVACLAAPLYAHHVAHTDPFRSNLDGTTVVNGKTAPIMQEESGGLGLGVTGLTLVIGYPVAFFLARTHSRWRGWLTILVVFPLLLNLVVRTFGWIALLVLAVVAIVAVWREATSYS